MEHPIQSVSDIPPLIATSVVRGSEQGQSHGGIYLIDPGAQAVHQVLDWDTADIDWTGRGWDRGLRGVAFYDGEVYVAASDELFVYDPNFRQLRSFRNRYLKHCHEICEYDGKLYLTSTGFDSILAFDLVEQDFVWGLHAAKVDGEWHAHRFDPHSNVGPTPRNQLHINNVDCSAEGLSFAGLRTGGIVSLGADAKLLQQVELPDGAHNAVLVGDGVLFNDTAADYLRFVTRDGDEKRFPFPTYAPGDLEYAGIDDSKIARQGFGRGLCIINERLVAAGSSPSTVTVFDLLTGQTVFSVNFSMDIRNAIHGLAVWPFATGE
ncbi:MAG: hypothetical protein KJO95_07955 [Gammaproteobacteria bacterium]|nr:hypothetical protein [Gammaproteobacteria bacterium]MBU2676049.1 hypothetical protein [Gammaproteobacteria bacterium]NNC57152.1 hypothetical protein [Woeseiaceae bacterium]NNL49785.1 hypothetical protein [Woeseiaceae bacterium]